MASRTRVLGFVTHLTENPATRLKTHATVLPRLAFKDPRARPLSSSLLEWPFKELKRLPKSVGMFLHADYIDEPMADLEARGWTYVWQKDSSFFTQIHTFDWKNAVRAPRAGCTGATTPPCDEMCGSVVDALVRRLPPTHTLVGHIHCAPCPPIKGFVWTACVSSAPAFPATELEPEPGPGPGLVELLEIARGCHGYDADPQKLNAVKHC
jgi:hypothetical protein